MPYTLHIPHQKYLTEFEKCVMTIPLQMFSIRSYPGGHLACWQLYKYLFRTANALRNEKAIFDKAKDIILYRSHDELLASEGYAFNLNPQRQQFFCYFSIYI